MRYRLRTLLIVLTLGPPFLAGGWFAWGAIAARYKAQLPEEPDLIEWVYVDTLTLPPTVIECTFDDTPPDEQTRNDETVVAECEKPN